MHNLKKLGFFNMPDFLLAKGNFDNYRWFCV